MATGSLPKLPEWINDELRRSYQLERASMDKEKRTIKVRFSSEAGVDRWGVTEILDHAPASVRMDRLNNGAAVLREHDVDKLIGITQGAEITSKRVGESTLKIAAGEDGDKALGLIEQDVLRWVSVGYRVHEWNIKDPDSDRPTYRAVDWEPFEISLVAIPADTSARVIRSGAAEQRTAKVNIMDEKKTESSNGGPPDNTALILDIKNSEKKRATAIRTSAAKYRTKVPAAVEQAQRAIDEDWSPEKFDLWVIEEHGRTESAGPSAQPAETANDFKGLGRRFIELPEMKAFLSTYQRGKKQRVNLEVELPGNFDAHNLTRATLTTTVSGLTKYERPPGLILLEQQPLLVAQLFAQGSTENTTIRFMKEDTFTNAATALAEEGQFAEMSWDLSEVDAPVRKVGVLGRITDEMLADSAQVASYFEARIPFAVAQRQDQQLMTGTGASNQITGILATSGIQTEAAAASPNTADAIAKAIAKVGGRVGFFQADFIVMNPLDWQNVTLLKDGNGQYLLGGPGYAPYGNGMYSNVGTLWGLPVVRTTAITAGTALVGAFRLGAQLWTRQGMLVEMTNSDASDFAFGRVAVRAYLRHALSVYRPLAFCSVTGIT